MRRWVPTAGTDRPTHDRPGPRHQSLAPLAGGEIGVDVRGAELLTQLGDLVRITEAVEHHFGAFGPERTGDREPDARGGAGDQRALAVQEHLHPSRN